LIILHVIIFGEQYMLCRDTRWRSWLRHYATSWKVAGFFNWPNPSSRTMALGSTQPLTEMSNRNLPGGKKRPERRADNLAAICEPNVWKCGSLNLSQPQGPTRPVQG
jgi:hypothetical protein